MLGSILVSPKNPPIFPFIIAYAIQVLALVINCLTAVMRRWVQNMVVSRNRGVQYKPPATIILLIGSQQRVSIILGDPSHRHGKWALRIDLDGSLGRLQNDPQTPQDWQAHHISEY